MAKAPKKQPQQSRKPNDAKDKMTECEDPVEVRVRYKYCVVPACRSTTTRTPEKLFFSIPTGELRERWCEVMGRSSGHKPLSPISNRFCCEDHFDLEQDMENYIKWKVMGTKKTKKLILKKGVFPHKFDCREVNDNTTKQQVKNKAQNAEAAGKGLEGYLNRCIRKRKMIDDGKPQDNQKLMKVSPISDKMIFEQRKKLQKILHHTKETEITRQEQSIETYTFLIKVEAEDNIEQNGKIIQKESIFQDPNTSIQDSTNLLDVKVKVEELDEEFEPEVIQEETQEYIIKNETNTTVVTKTNFIKTETLRARTETNSSLTKTNSVILSATTSNEEDIRKS